ncbi:MAG TPA: hypothetical protein VM925_13830 [Labilithrix sp.]|jgi:hypothetical protein|nr:hypothetical protein [Labilithrix sp.]
MKERDFEIDVAATVARFPWVDGVFALRLSPEAKKHSDILTIAIVLQPYDIERLVQTHYALLAATDDYEVTGRILYVNGANPSPAPMARARPIVLHPVEREAAVRRRIDGRRGTSARPTIVVALRLVAELRQAQT